MSLKNAVSLFPLFVFLLLSAFQVNENNITGIYYAKNPKTWIYLKPKHIFNESRGVEWRMGTWTLHHDTVVLRDTIFHPKDGHVSLELSPSFKKYLIVKKDTLLEGREALVISKKNN